MKPSVAHVVLLAFIAFSTLSPGNLSSLEEIELWWKPLQTPKKPFWKRGNPIYSRWIPLKTTPKPVERNPTIQNSWWKPFGRKSTSPNPWWRHLQTTEKPFWKKNKTTFPWWRPLQTTEKSFWKREEATYSWSRPFQRTEKPFWKRNNDPYPWWKPLITTEKPFWKRDYPDSYEDNRQNIDTTALVLALFITPLVFFAFIILCRIYACSNEGDLICLTSPCQEHSSFPSSQIPRREILLETSSSRNVRNPMVFSVNYSSAPRDLFSSGTNGRSSSNSDNTRDRPPEYSAVVLSDLVDDLVDGNKIFPTVNPAIPETPPPKYDGEFLPKF